jgi:hypothetical protein
VAWLRTKNGQNVSIHLERYDERLENGRRRDTAWQDSPYPEHPSNSRSTRERGRRKKVKASELRADAACTTQL